MRRVRAADDFETIRLRLEELRRERAQLYLGGPVRGSVPHPEAAVRRPVVPDRRTPPAVRRQLRTQFWNAR
jgi:hypothetical protein